MCLFDVVTSPTTIYRKSYSNKVRGKFKWTASTEIFIILDLFFVYRFIPIENSFLIGWQSINHITFWEQLQSLGWSRIFRNVVFLRLYCSNKCGSTRIFWKSNLWGILVTVIRDAKYFQNLLNKGFKIVGTRYLGFSSGNWHWWLLLPFTCSIRKCLFTRLHYVCV